MLITLDTLRAADGEKYLNSHDKQEGDMKTAADGDDYTWQNLPGGAVLNAEQTRDVLAGQTVTLEIDLRTPDQKLKELASRIVELEKEVLSLRLTLERIFEIRL